MLHGENSGTMTNTGRGVMSESSWSKGDITSNKNYFCCFVTTLYGSRLLGVAS